ncbi:hypothetical protein [Paracidovorax cattleyae]|uniref:Uncharacterized protein n=1 Tax=Paracidovorax cattleyae TaxID=80868 RepID=A0A1H0LEV6_9BURK|nr:hypothetical protein [Paracidovorax cattleyae]AVS75263.1 hypothetical protein C8240_15865 [Paracidovorax cattleyae]MBF9264609.1 hypothetical protein [Paracidovorax cattleyae]SDO66606.1 hypothetical protein SAMN04489708_102166 [Paracidovorax cattleyae]
MKTKTASTEKHLKFDATISTGTIFQLLAFIGSVILAYGSFCEERVRQDSRIAQAEAMAGRDRESVREAIREVRERVDTLERSHQNARESLVTLQSCARASSAR